MRVVTWNMAGAFQAPGAEKHENAWEYLASLEPDIALVQEAMVPDWVGSSYSVLWRPAHSNCNWGTAVVSRYSILEEIDIRAAGAGLGETFEQMQDRIIGARLDLEGSPLLAVSVHAPSWVVSEEASTPELVEAVKLQMSKGVWDSDIAFGAIRLIPESGLPFVVGGDWNTGRLFDQTWRPCGGAEFFERMEGHGFVDCVDRTHGEEQQTWFRDGDAPYQLDHLFCDGKLAGRLRSCDVDSRPAEALGLSDHAPIVAEWS